MDNQTGGLSPSERQRKTVAEITRKKVLEAYERSGQSASNSNEHKNQNPTISKEEWHKYHSAWQNYYQKYYGEYYRNAARNYIATEKLKRERASADERNLLESDSENHQEPILEPEKKQENIKSHLRETIQKEAEKQIKHTKKHRHLIPILAGVTVVLIFLFLQYNRLIFAPLAAYVSPGNNEGSTITAIDNTNVTVTAEPKLIIPKLNVDVPVHFGISNDTKTINDAMNNGVAHFMIPGADAYPGQIGNLIISGHSAGDVYSNNQYKFIFSGLERLSPNDTLYINYNSTRFTYSVKDSEIVEPTDLAALTKPTDKPMLTLVTCTPLGTSRYRLLVHAEQISPSPTEVSSQENQDNSPTEKPTNNTSILPSNPATFFESIWNFLTGKQ